MNRFVQFFRSLVPADPSQLLLIVGLGCLAVVPRLEWLRRSDFSSFVGNLSYTGNASTEGIRQYWAALVNLASYMFIFTASAGFFTCCWPGKRHARRIFLLVILPAFAGLLVICAGFFRLLSFPRSVLQRGPTFGHGPAWIISKLWNSGTAFHFWVAGFVLVAAFAILLELGKASSPISISPQNPSGSSSHRRLERLQESDLDISGSARAKRDSFELDFSAPLADSFWQNSRLAKSALPSNDATC